MVLSDHAGTTLLVVMTSFFLSIETDDAAILCPRQSPSGEGAVPESTEVRTWNLPSNPMVPSSWKTALEPVHVSLLSELVKIAAPVVIVMPSLLRKTTALVML
jgi:hypothetical protein